MANRSVRLPCLSGLLGAVSSGAGLASHVVEGAGLLPSRRCHVLKVEDIGRRATAFLEPVLVDHPHAEI